MKLTGLFKRGAACLCTAAILMGGVSAFALSPALPDEPAPAELSVTNAVSEAQLRSALSKLTVTYDTEIHGGIIVGTLCYTLFRFRHFSYRLK